MKKFILCLAAFMLIITGCSAQPSPSAQQPEQDLSGAYQGTAWGNNDEINVEVILEAGSIKSIEVLDHHETKGISDLPLTVIPEQIIKTQSLAVDALSGATMTSNGIKNAVKDALQQAAGETSKWEIKPEGPAMEVKDDQCDVIVVGSGAAGMTAAIAAAQQGAKVILIEKQDILGGTSLLSNSMFGSVGTSVHQKEGKTETVEDLYQNYMKQEAATGAYAKAEAARILAENAADRAEYLISLGVELDHTSSAFILAPKGGSGLGAMVIPALQEELEKLEVDVRSGTKAVSILTEEDQVKGVSVTTRDGEYNINAKAVIMATGGYAASKEMVSQYLPQWKDSIYYCSPGNTGDGLKMAQNIGVELIDMTVMKANPLVFYDRTRAQTMNAAVNAGAILVNHEGKRFVNEQGSYGISPVINEQTKQEAIVLFDNTLLETNETIKAYAENGYLTAASSLHELAEKMEISSDALEETVKQYQEMVKAGIDTEFSRKTLADLYGGETFYGIVVKPSIQGTFGGIPTNTDTEVLNPQGDIIPGFYAVGECAQEGVNGLNPMTTNLVFGKISGEKAAAFALMQ